MPPIDCHTRRPVRMSSLVNTTVPSSATTRSGIGGASRKISEPAQSRTPKEMASNAPSAIHSLRVLSILASCRLAAWWRRRRRRSMTQVKRGSGMEDASGHVFEPWTIDQLDLAPVHAHDALVLEALEHAAHRFRREPQVVRDVGARHGQLEAVR